MTARRGAVFTGFNVGAIASAVLLAFGIELVVSTLEEPLAAATVPLLNWISRAGRFDFLQLSVNVYWPLTIYSGLGGIILLAVGIKLAAWVSSGA